MHCSEVVAILLAVVLLLLFVLIILWARHYYFVREKVLVGEVDLVCVSTKKHVADIFTKAV